MDLATPDSVKLAENAMQNYNSKYGERYCTLNWRPGVTSSIVKKVESKSWIGKKCKLVQIR